MGGKREGMKGGRENREKGEGRWGKGREGGREGEGEGEGREREERAETFLSQS